MKKNSIILIFSLFATLTNASIFITPKAPQINASSYVVLDFYSSQIIAENNLHKKHSPASLTKLMTAYVVFQMIKEKRINLTDNVRISEKAWKTGGSKSFIEVGKNIKLETLLKGMIVQSGNDSAVALAEHVGGTEGTFAAYMNEYARELGMINSNFENASGLPNAKQYTTAYDIALLSIATIRDFPQFYKWYGQKDFTYNNIKQRNRNKLLFKDNTIDGLKTGFTEKAGYNLATSAKRVGMRLISVVLGSKSTQDREAQTQVLLNYSFRFFETIKIDNINENIAIAGYDKDYLKVGLSATTYITLARGQYRLADKLIKLNTKLPKPITKNTEVGKLIIKQDNDILKEIPVVALENIKEAGFFSRMLNTIGF